MSFIEFILGVASIIVISLFLQIVYFIGKIKTLDEITENVKEVSENELN